jgi:hypothetical protein
MHWFRSNMHFGAGSALFGLALQLALSFGHVHRDQLVPAAAATTLGATSEACSTAAPDGPSPAHKSDGSDDGLCAVCALIQLAGTSMPSVAPALAAPSGFLVIRLDTPIELASAALPRLLFQARAPPAA